MAYFRILAIDGGGVRGFLPAAILANLEQYLDQKTGTPVPLASRFDLIAATSVGGILGLALASGVTARDSRDRLVELIPKIFANPGISAGWLGPKYEAGPLRAALTSIFGDKTLATLTTDTCITSVALPNASPRFHKTAYLTRNAGRLDESLVDISMATSAAPTYFPAHSTKHSVDLVDGGLVANNPSMVALVDALQFDRPSMRGMSRPSLAPTEDGSTLTLLSVGTGEPGCVPYDAKRLVDGGKCDWAKPIYEVLMHSQSKLVHHQAAFLVGERYFRASPMLPSIIELDDRERFLELRNYADITAPLISYADKYLV